MSHPKAILYLKQNNIAGLNDYLESDVNVSKFQKNLKKWAFFKKCSKERKFEAGFRPN